jgi:hypothetical protein
MFSKGALPKGKTALQVVTQQSGTEELQGVFEIQLKI